MKRLKLKAIELGATEVLSREQLRKVMDGAPPAGCAASACGPQGQGNCETAVVGCICKNYPDSSC